MSTTTEPTTEQLLIAALVRAANDFNVIAESNQIPGHVAYLSKPKIALLAARGYADVTEAVRLATATPPRAAADAGRSEA